ncbi:MAG: GNAT family N-acetyltransferase [Brachymonas sp.]|jgi:RimJ/RimL family protein N-acetyltransferase|nr:GNAT family N-acetyltransferase [Brachymonas sp.]MBP6967086.1 GNAT family N-acetyltransferase [Brachymonas sp.]MBP7724802.1 GNAT family N-acetyltransferase [Brachymonas sp.]MBP7733836.1 GNAT family N-acetyltransferase [Brachymonas sp.]MBP7744269.1 GNAT family N-acetyltransferase [Brachymonas sp.]
MSTDLHDTSLALLQKAHCDALHALANDAHISPTSSIPHPCPPEVITGWLADNQNAQGPQKNFTILHKGEIAGVAMLKKIDHAAKHAELAYWVGYPFWGKGIGQRAAQITVQHAFTHMGLQRLHSHCLKQGNPASRKILERLGFVPDAQRADMPTEDRFAQLFPGDFWAFYALTLQEFTAAKRHL